MIGFYPSHGVLAVKPISTLKFLSCVHLSLVMWRAVKHIEKNLVRELLASLWRYQLRRLARSIGCRLSELRHIIAFWQQELVTERLWFNFWTQLPMHVRINDFEILFHQVLRPLFAHQYIIFIGWLHQIPMIQLSLAIWRDESVNIPHFLLLSRSSFWAGINCELSHVNSSV